MSDISAREFGRLEAEVTSLKDALDEHKRESKEALAAATAKMDELLALANKGRGAYWAGLTLASGIGAVITFVVSTVWPR